MGRLVAGLLVAIMLYGCQHVMPLTNEEVAENAPRRNEAVNSGGFCRYENGEVIPTGDPDYCPARPFNLGVE